MKLKSIFASRERIPSEHTCDGEDVNPPLELIDIPQSAKSLVIIVDDPDSPSKIWSHWILWNISPTTKEIKQNSVPKEAMEGINDFGKLGYGGPCPHSGTHRYQFKLYALDVKLNLPKNSTKEDVENAMEGHILDRALLIGLYSKNTENL
jgi:hypothetical protein